VRLQHLSRVEGNYFLGREKMNAEIENLTIVAAKNLSAKIGKYLSSPSINWDKSHPIPVFEKEHRQILKSEQTKWAKKHKRGKCPIVGLTYRGIQLRPYTD
jgi:hypothetical protein